MKTLGTLLLYLGILVLCIFLIPALFQGILVIAAIGLACGICYFIWDALTNPKPSK